MAANFCGGVKDLMMGKKPKAAEEMDRLIAGLDKDTWSNIPSRYTLALYGDPAASPFLRSLMRKADKFEIKYAVNSMTSPANKVVADKETAEPFYMSEEMDLDNLQHDGTSSVSEAIYMLLDRLDLIHGKDITIVGRGHSVKGLAGWLIHGGATVTVAHSETKSLLTATKGKDVVIYATPKLDKLIAYDTESLVIDLGGAVEHPGWFNCDYVSGIGRLTVSVLINRLVHEE